MKKKLNKKVTLNTINNKIDTLTGAVGGLTTTVNDLTATVDNLAIATKRGFDNAVLKDEFSEFKNEMTDFKKKTGLTLFNLDSHAQETNRRLNNLEKTGGPLTMAVQTIQQETRSLNQRVNLLEKNKSK